MEANQVLRDNLSSTSSTTLEDIDSAEKDLHSSIECIICYSILPSPFWLMEKGKDKTPYYFPGSLKLDHDACANINCMLIPCCGELRELRSGHYHKTVEITQHTGKCFEEEYTVGCIDIDCHRHMMLF